MARDKRRRLAAPGRTATRSFGAETQQRLLPGCGFHTACTCDSSSCSLCQPGSSPGTTQWAGEASNSLYVSQRSPLSHKTSRPLQGTRHAACSSSNEEASGERGPCVPPQPESGEGRRRGARQQGSSGSSPETTANMQSSSGDDLRACYGSSNNLWTLEQDRTKRRKTSLPCMGDGVAGASEGGCDRLAWRTQRQAWWQPAWSQQPLPIGAHLAEVDAFSRPQQRSSCDSHANDIVCGLDFTQDGEMLAGVGVAKQIRIYSMNGISEGGLVQRSPIIMHRMAAKMTSIAWSPDDEGVVTVGDYDGEVSQVHVATGHIIGAVDEHAGRRVWSVAHSALRPQLCASTSEDGSARLWAGRGLATAAGILQPGGRAPLCHVSFCSSNENLLALASADSAAYVYDLRQINQPLAALRGHRRPVSYVRWLGAKELVTASTDSSLGWWRLDSGSPNVCSGSNACAFGDTWSALLLKSFCGHSNAKNFIGLSVREDGLLACGSESGEVVAYHTSWSDRLAAYSAFRPRMLPVSPTASTPNSLPAPGDLPAPCGGGQGESGDMAEGEFVSAVCWQPGQAVGTQCSGGRPLLAAATSTGELRLLALNVEPPCLLTSL